MPKRGECPAPSLHFPLQPVLCNTPRDPKECVRKGLFSRRSLPASHLIHHRIRSRRRFLSVFRYLIPYLPALYHLQPRRTDNGQHLEDPVPCLAQQLRNNWPGPSIARTVVVPESLFSHAAAHSALSDCRGGSTSREHEGPD